VLYPSILGIVLAGGKGERLSPLTRDRSKPAVPFAGKYRIVDFVLSNLSNSGIYSVYVLVQYKSQSLIEHLSAAWRMGSRMKGHFVTVVPPQMRRGERWYRGTADATYQNLHLIRDLRPDLVAIFGADHIYRMDVGQMIKFHLEQQADATVAALPVPLVQASRFGVIETDPTNRIIGFSEKPKRPKSMPTDQQMAYASMGNYIFHTETLLEALRRDAQRESDHDFGKSIVPDLCERANVFAYNFMRNEVPGVKPYEEKGYWRDVGNIESYWKAHMDLLGPYPSFDLENPQWPILSESHDGPAARIIGGEIEDSLICEGSTIQGGKIRRSVIGHGVSIEKGAQIEESLLIGYTQIGANARLKKVIIDRFNTIKPSEEIGPAPEQNKSRYTADASGIVTLSRGETPSFYRR